MILQTARKGTRFPWQVSLTYWLPWHCNTILVLLGQRRLSRTPRHIFYKGERCPIFSWHFGVNIYLLSCTHWRAFRVPTERRRHFHQNQRTKTCKFWGFLRSLTENSFLPGYNAAWTSNRNPKFREKIVPSPSKLDRIYQPFITSKGRDAITHWHSVPTRKNGFLILSDLFCRSDWGKRWRTFSWLTYWRFLSD